MLHIDLSIEFTGKDTDSHLIDAYDVSQALVGFHRTIALTTHLLLNGEIITQSNKLEGARVFLFPPEAGSWKTTAVVLTTILGGVYTFGTAPKDTPVGHLARSLYDYVISELLGVDVDYEKTLRQQIEDTRRRVPDLPNLDQTRVDSLIEKCEMAAKAMHRPIIFSQTASAARLYANIDGSAKPIAAQLDSNSYDHLNYTFEELNITEFSGKISSYNKNTFKGRIYIEEEKRPIPFEISRYNRERGTTEIIAESISQNIISNSGDIRVFGKRRLSKSGRLKSIAISSLARFSDS